MYLFHLTLLALVALSSTALLPSRSYLPQQGGFQSSHSSQTHTLIGSSSSSSTGNTRPQQAIEKNADILKQDTEVGESGFHYSFETSNGIRAEESNNAGNSQGGFSYKGDDGITYTITYTAGEGGYRAQGAHLPVAPPTPEAILIALQQNAKDEAAGIFDDGKYDPAKHGGGMSSSGSGYIQSSSSSSSRVSSTNHQTSYSSSGGYRY